MATTAESRIEPPVTLRVRMTPKISPLGGSLGELLNKTWTNRVFSGYIRADGVLLPESYKEVADEIENFEVRDDDVWVISFPKCGTTWAQEMVWCIANEMDSEEIEVPISERFPWLESWFALDTLRLHDLQPASSSLDSFKQLENLPSPRFIKSHLPFHLLPRQLRNGVKKPKIVYVARNPKDTCISYFNFVKFAYKFEGTLEDMCRLFIGDTIIMAPFWNHVLAYWEKRNDDNILFAKYEDMKKDLPNVLAKTATFLGTNLTSDKLSKLCEHLSFASMKVNPAVNYQSHIAQLQVLLKTTEKGAFMRNGNVDQWKTVLSPEMIKRFDDWTSQCTEGTGLHL